MSGNRKGRISCLRGIAHALESTSHHDASVTELQRLSGKGNGLHTACADLVNGRCLSALRAASSQRYLTCWALAKTSSDDIAEVDFLDELGVQLDVVQGLFSSDGAQLDGS